MAEEQFKLNTGHLLPADIPLATASSPQPQPLGPFILSSIKSIRLPPLPTASSQTSFTNNPPRVSITRTIPLANATMAQFGPARSTMPRLSAPVGRSSPGVRPIGTPGPFILTSRSQSPRTEPIYKIESRPSQLVRKVSAAGLATAGHTPKIKRRKTVRPAYPAGASSDDDDDEDENEVRGTWEKTGRARPQFGMEALSD